MATSAWLDNTAPLPRTVPESGTTVAHPAIPDQVPQVVPGVVPGGLVSDDSAKVAPITHIAPAIPHNPLQRGVESVISSHVPTLIHTTSPNNSLDQFSHTNSQPRVQPATESESTLHSVSSVIDASHLLNRQPILTMDPTTAPLPSKIHWGTIIFGALSVVFVGIVIYTVYMVTQTTKQVATNISSQADSLNSLLEDDTFVPKVEAVYKNPLDVESSYQNPFTTELNPFDEIEE